MKNYILGRLFRAIISVFIVTAIAMVMIYTLIPREQIFKTDATYQKLGGKADDRTRYKYNSYKKLGYVDFLEQTDMCKVYAENVEACNAAGSAEIKDIAAKYEAEGYTVEQYKSGLYYVYKDVPVSTIITKFFTNMIQIDHPWIVTDASNPDLDANRRVYWGKDYNGLPALMGNGTKHKYLIYLDSSFPFIHQNIVGVNLGLSYPAYSYTPIIEVITSSQGKEDATEQLFETGNTAKSAIIQHSCQYKNSESLDRMDKNKFNDNYADCKTMKTDPSMVQYSMTFGICALIIGYCIAIPAGMAMARHKGKLGDTIGTIWINFMISVPSLAFIFFGNQLLYMLGLPQSFPQLGAHDIRSYIPAILILGLMNTAGLMLWTRRYMIDQESSDYVKFAKAKGLSQKEIFRKHIMRNAIIPIVHNIPANIILTITGAVLTETVFAIPGTGKLLPDAITDHNNQMIVALTMVFTALSIISVLLGDLLMTAIDPRIQLQQKKGGAH